MKITEVMNDLSVLIKFGTETSQTCQECGKFFLTTTGKYCGECQTVAQVLFYYYMYLMQRWNVMPKDDVHVESNR